MNSQLPLSNTHYMNQVAALFTIICLVTLFTHRTLAQSRTEILIREYRNEILQLSDELTQKEQEINRINAQNYQLQDDTRLLKQEINELKNRIRLIETYLFTRGNAEVDEMKKIEQEMLQANFDFQQLNGNFETLKTTFIRSSFHVFYASYPGPSSSMMVLRRPVQASLVKYLEFNFTSIESPTVCYVSVRNRNDQIFINTLPVSVQNYKGTAFVEANLPPGYYTVYVSKDRTSPSYVCFDFSLF